MSKKKTNTKLHESKPNPSEISVEGIVEEALPNAMFRVRLQNDAIVLCTICGKMRKNNIRVLPGDKVDVGVSIYDMTRGRINYRYK